MTDDRREFDAIYLRHHPPIVRYLSRFVGLHEAEDLAQEVFAKVSRGLRDFRGESQVSTWIYRIATNAALDRLRSPSFRSRKAKEFPVEDQSGCGEGEACAEGASCGSESRFPVEQQVVRKEMNECIRDRIGRLPEPYRSTLVLGDLAEFANAEVAGMTGASLDTVKIRLHRARARLRKDLEANCSLYRDERNELACDRKTNA